MNISGEDKKKLVVVAIAMGVGVVAAILVGNYIKSEMAKKEEENRLATRKAMEMVRQEMQVKLKQEMEA